ncbi:SMP-30/gluconolactonase/LRE family protein [Sphingopyxis sp. GW247-27LB]|uniref:SMP-30/gluconolactonase/LRE family protein n=1 Tax=Sphingopyxis sp. GW247-27LB TaxID=2012632 RepID=UPI000BA54702|nr:SMP-30/gluconolactonase/LRE family protein [Sphingopyxis sp. GW247-27LB]PAL21791.1 gluconolaconase [Sphingopyxis sp. GW247-27LB]
MAEIRIVERARRDRLGEGLLWSDREQAVYWTDILERRVNRLTLIGGRIDSWEVPQTIGWVIERQGAPGLIAGHGREIVRLTLDPLAIETIAAPEPDRDGNRMNDAKADALGRIWAGTMPVTCDRPSGAFYRLDPDGRIARVDGPYTIANGPAIAPGGDMLLHTDTALGTIFRFAIRDDGSLGPREPFITFEKNWGSPDGMTFDAEGGLWVACWGGSGVMRFDPLGKPERRIALPASQITNMVFAGADLDRMFVTSAADGVERAEPDAGALFEVDPGCRGLPAGRYAG